jgi:hypothetical protein
MWEPCKASFPYRLSPATSGIQYRFWARMAQAGTIASHR